MELVHDAGQLSDDKNAGIAPEASQAMECPIWNDLTDSTVQGLIGQTSKASRTRIDNAAPALASSYKRSGIPVGDGSFGTDPWLRAALG